MTAEPLTDEIRDTCLEAHDDIIWLQDALAESASKNFKLRLALSCVLPIAEERATTASEKRIVGFINRMMDGRPMPEKPKLVLVKS